MFRRRRDRDGEPCGGCGYDVSGLPDSERCPECGYDLSAARLMYLERAGQDWRQRVQLGIVVMSWGMGLHLAAVFLPMLVLGILTFFEQDRPGVIAGILIGLGPVASILTDIGVSLVARRDPAMDESRPRTGLLCAAVCSMVVAFAALLLPWSGFIDFRDWAILSWLFGLRGVAVALRVFFLLGMVLDLTRRLPVHRPLAFRRGMRAVLPTLIGALACAVLLPSALALPVVAIALTIGWAATLYACTTLAELLVHASGGPTSGPSETVAGELPDQGGSIGA
ncbi:MAG: hypothetical protein AAGG07_06835 [Planctomycetota bacterium]